MPSRHARRAGLAFIVLSVFLDSVAQSISFPILPRLAEQLLGGDTAAAARWVGYLEVGWALPQFFAAPLLGLLSDRFGRRPVIVISVFVVGVELIVGALATNVWQLLAARALCGVACGGQAAAMAYVADVTAPEARARSFGWVNGALWSGVVMGPALAGLLAQTGLRAPFWAAAAFALLGGAYGLLVLPESLPAGARTPLGWSRASPLGAVDILARPALALLAAAMLLTWFAFQAKDNMLVLYTAHRYGWTPLAFGLFATALALGTIAVQGLGVGLAVRRFGERATAIGGLALEAAGFAAVGLAPTSALFCTGNLPIVLGAVAAPTLQSLMSARVGADEQGRLQGALGSLVSLTSITAPVAFTQVFAWAIQRGPAWSGLTILIGAGLTLAAAALVLATGRAQPTFMRTGPM